jgi:hypothetical protein
MNLYRYVKVLCLPEFEILRYIAILHLIRKGLDTCGSPFCLGLVGSQTLKSLTAEAIG